MTFSATVRRGSWRLLSVGVVAALTLGACSSGGSSGDSSSVKKITFWYSTSAQDKGYTELAKDFLAKTGITVDIVNIPNDGYQDKLKQAAQANSLPDTASVPSLDNLWVNQLQDLSSIANATANNINKTLITQKDGKVLAIPSDVTAAGLFINKSLFDKANVTYPTDPSKTWTWDEFLAAADKVRTATKVKYDLVYDNSPARIRAWIYTHGGKGFQLDGDKFAAPDATTVQALSDFAKINNDVTMPKSVWTSGADPNALFKSGQVVAYFSGVWQVADFADSITNFEWVSAPTPAQPVHATDINLGGKVVAFNNKNTASAAKQWIDFLYQPANYTKLASANGYLPIESGLTLTYPFTKQAALDSFALYNKEIAAADPISASGQANQTKLLLDGKATSEDPTKAEMAKLINGQQDITKTVDNIVTGLNAGL
jgi:alpha-1,4-digalacturonate transport system substrate-binding protein